MKTTLEIEESVMRSLKEKAAREGTTMSALVERALRTMLDEKPVSPKELPPLPTWDLGLRINVDSRAEYLDALDDEGGDDVPR